jgi:hypothetical protein
MHYDRNFVLLAYRAQHPNQLEPADTVLDNFDETLRVRYDSELTSQMTSAGIIDSVFNRAILMFFATCSPAAGFQTKVRHAVKFFQQVKPTETVPPPVVTDG